MNRLDLDEILDLDHYEAVRDEYRARVIEHKNDRRLAVGDKITLVFEDRETLRYQIQEMTRVERIQLPEKVQLEIDVYNELVPGTGELTATLFIEIPDLSKVKAELERLIGIDECVSIEIPALAGGEPMKVRGEFDAEQMEEDRISAVQYVHFKFTDAQVRAFETAEGLTLTIEHAAYRESASIPSAMRASLANDLRGEAVSLLDVEAARALPTALDVTLRETDRVLIRRPARPAGPEHTIVESKLTGASLLNASPELLLAAMEEARVEARAIAARTGASRILIESGEAEPAEGARLRIHILGAVPA